MVPNKTVKSSVPRSPVFPGDNHYCQFILSLPNDILYTNKCTLPTLFPKQNGNPPSEQTDTSLGTAVLWRLVNFPRPPFPPLK
jgi:hypothetical protein